MNDLKIQTLYSKADILDILLRTESIYIYGAGRITKEMVVFLRKQGLFRKVTSLLVTDKNCNPTQYIGIDVHSCDETNLDKEKLVVVAVNLYSVLDIIEILKSNSYTNIALLSSRLIEEFLKGENTHHVQHTLLNFNIALTEHCNMNCKNCYSFSPIADEKFLDVTEFEKDSRQLSEIFGSECGLIQLRGGEPLLHPELKSIIKKTREIFCIGKIKLFTNGLLLNEIEENLWKIFQEHDIEIVLNKYKTEIRDDILKEKADLFDVKYKIIDFTRSNFLDTKIYSYGISERLLLDIDGQSAELNFSYCPYATQFPQLKHGKLYRCSMPANISYINTYYNLDFHVSELDYIDIYEVETAEGILRRLPRPLPFCRYCRTLNMVYDVPWNVSRKEKCEWIVER